jgi:hypothetical protein
MESFSEIEEGLEEIDWKWANVCENWANILE